MTFCSVNSNAQINSFYKDKKHKIIEVILKFTNVSHLFKWLYSYSRREYRSVEKNVPPPSPAYRRYATHVNGCIPTECKGLMNLFFLPSDTFLRNVLRQMGMLILSYQKV